MERSLTWSGRAGKATVFSAIALAATFDPDLIERTAYAISDEARAKYNLFQKKNKGQYSGLTFWSPNVNIFRDLGGVEDKKLMERSIFSWPNWKCICKRSSGL